MLQAKDERREDEAPRERAQGAEHDRDHALGVPWRAAMKIHETTKTDGSLAATRLAVVDGDLVVENEDGSFVLPEGALPRVMARYGAPIEDGTKLTEVDALDLGASARLRHVRHLARFDVIAKDWLVYEAVGAEPICALAHTVAGALGHLARAAARTPDSGS